MLSVKCVTYEGNFPLSLACMAPYGMSDKGVVMCGTLKGMEEAKQTKSAKALRILPRAAVGAFILGSAIKRPGKFSDKIGQALLTTGEFAVLGVGLKAFGKIASSYSKNSSSAQEFRKDHPETSAVLAFGGAFLAMGLALFGAKKLINIGMDKCPKITYDIAKELKKAGEYIDKKEIAKKVEKFKTSYQKFAKKRGGVYKFATDNVFPIGILAYIGAAIGLKKKNLKERNELIEKNIVQVARERDLASLMMDI